MSPFSECMSNLSRWRAALGAAGVIVAAGFMVWLLLGWFGWVPSMVEVFGVAGMRTPASITVAGLLLAAIAFRDC